MTTKNIKLIALDIDGTIMDKNFHISEQVKAAIKKAIAKNIYVVLATGRMYSATVPVAKELGLKTPLILYQGSLIQEFYNSDKVLLHHSLSKEHALSVVKDLRDYDIQINAYLNDNLYAEEISPILNEYSSKRDIPVFKVDNFDALSDFEPTKLLGLDYNTDLVEKIKNELKEKYKGIINITKSTQHFCEFVNKKCSKATSLLFLAEKWEINPSEIMAIGDQDNDKEMLEIAGFGVAMGNGDKKLQEIADFVTDTVDNNGAAIAIERFAL
jgi:Cof subfamily protein (haloacid dehalogenase superfamily)